MNTSKILIENNYVANKIIEYEKNDLLIKKQIDNEYVLYVNNVQWMSYNEESCIQALEFYPQYYLAKGHCICTGFGLGIRERWLLQNKNVTKITVLEKNKSIIDYQKEVNPDLCEKIEIINCDCLDYKGCCDTLLLDHYELQDWQYIFNNAKEIIQNIKCETLYVWSIESYLINRKKIFKDIHYIDLYNKMKDYYSLTKLPNLSKEQVNEFVSILIKE
jgi:hypothetical protein